MRVALVFLAQLSNVFQILFRQSSVSSQNLDQSSAKSFNVSDTAFLAHWKALAVLSKLKISVFFHRLTHLRLTHGSLFKASIALLTHCHIQYAILFQTFSQIVQSQIHFITFWNHFLKSSIYHVIIVYWELHNVHSIAHVDWQALTNHLIVATTA